MPNFKVGMFKYTGVPREDFLSWEAKLPQGAWMLLAGDPWSCSDGWRDIQKTNQIQVAFSSWRYISDYRSYADYDADLLKACYPETWEVDYLSSINQYVIPEDRGHGSTAGESLPA